MHHKCLKVLKDYVIITLGCLMYSFAFNCFFDPNNLAMGGFTGIAQVINRFVPILPIGTMVFVMNIPLIIIGMKKQGRRILFTTFYAITVSSVMIDTINAFVRFPPTDPLLSCIYGGVLLGISLGVMMLKSATTGGTELAARLLKYALRNLSIGKICLIIDVAVICIYALTFRSIDNALYGIIAMYVSSLAMDMVVYGSSNAKLAYIISDKSENIKEKLISMGLGATIINGSGAFTGNSKNILMCAARPNKIARIKAAVVEIDQKNSFIIVTDAKEVLGEGFGEFNKNSL